MTLQGSTLSPPQAEKPGGPAWVRVPGLFKFLPSGTASLGTEASALDNGAFPRPRRPPPPTLPLRQGLPLRRSRPPRSSEARLGKAPGLRSDPHTGGPPGAALAQGSAARPLQPQTWRWVTAGQGSALPRVSSPGTLAPRPPPEANMELPDLEEEPPSLLEAGGGGFPGILLHNGPAALQRPAGMHTGPPEAQVDPGPFLAAPLRLPHCLEQSPPWSVATRTQLTP